MAPKKRVIKDSTEYWFDEAPVSPYSFKRYGNTGFPFSLSFVDPDELAEVKQKLDERFPNCLEMWSTRVGYPPTGDNKQRKIRVYQKREAAPKKKRRRPVKSTIDLSFPPPRCFGWPTSFNPPVPGSVDVDTTRRRIRLVLNKLHVYSQALSEVVQHLKYTSLVMDLQVKNSINYVFYGLLSEYHIFNNEFPQHIQSKEKKSRRHDYDLDSIILIGDDSRYCNFH
eukprot:Platyproteum_vivax@DN286_c0_g1_i1.p1